MSRLIHSNVPNQERLISIINETKGQNLSWDDLMTRLQDGRQVIGHVTDYKSLADSLAEAESAGKEFGLHPLTNPELVHAVATSPEFYAAIRPNWTTSTTGEVLGTIDGVAVIQDQHGVGVFATSKGIVEAIAQGYLTNGFLPAPLIREGEGVTIVGYEALRNGDAHGLTGYVTQLENLKLVTTDMSVKEVESIRKERPVAYVSDCWLPEERARQDDLILSRNGSPQGVDLFCKVLYSPKSEGGEGYKTVGTWNGIGTKGLPETGAGRPVVWRSDNHGLDDYDIYDCGRFASGK